MAAPADTRIPLLDRHQVPAEVATVYDAPLFQQGVVPNMFKTLAHTPALALGIAGFLKALLGDGALPGWYKELVATRLSVLLGSEYAIAGHSVSARQKGASKEQIEAAKGDFEKGPFTEAEKMGFRCAERLHRSAREVDGAFYAQLRALFDEPQIIELMATAGAFEFFPRFVDGLAIPITPTPEGVFAK